MPHEKEILPSHSKHLPALFYFCRVDVIPQGSVCDFKRAAVHITFPPGAVTELVHVTCSLCNPERCKPPVAETEALVSNVIEVVPLDLTFAEHVTLALSYSATKLKGYEVVVKKLNRADNTWEELHTIDTREETGDFLDFVLF